MEQQEVMELSFQEDW